MVTRTVLTSGFASNALEQGLQRYPGVAAPPVRRIDCITDLYHPGPIRRPVVASPGPNIYARSLAQ
jgi:hypothetical protein